MDQRDASGLGRLQINDSNWQVCSQDPAPGAVVELSTIVTLASVKLSESAPDARHGPISTRLVAMTSGAVLQHPR